MSEPFKMLCSFAYYSAVGEFAAKFPAPPMLFGDSGAHSARTLGIHLTLEDYAGWCRRFDPELTVYANLDVIGAPEATYHNQKRLEEEYGLNPVPVFHTGEPWRWLERYLEDGYPYIALGKLLGNPVPAVLAWLAKAFRIAQGAAVFHGFGLTVWEALRDFPFYSVDSSTWSSSFRWGTVALFDRGRWVRIRLRDKDAVLKHRELIRAHGCNPVAVASKQTYDRAAVAALSAVAFHRAEEWLRARHGPITPPAGSRNPYRRGPSSVRPGLHLYLAESGGTWLLRAAEGVHRYRTPSIGKAEVNT